MRNITPIIPINLNKPLIRLATPRKTDKRYRDEYMPASFKKFKTKHTRHTPLYQKMSKKLIIRHASHPYQIKSFPKKNSACDAIRSISKKLHKRAYEFTHRIENGEYLGTIKNSLLNYISKFTKSNHALKILFVIAILEKCTKLNEKQKQSFLLFFKMQYPDYSPLSTGYLTDI